MVGVGRDLCWSSSPTLLPKQGPLQEVVEDLVQAGLEYLQRRRLHNLPGSLFQCSDTEKLRFAKELIGELYLQGLPSVSLPMLGVAQHSASEGWLDVSVVIESHNILPHSHASQHLMPTVRSGVMTNTDSAGNYRHSMKTFSIISCLP